LWTFYIVATCSTYHWWSYIDYIAFGVSIRQSISRSVHLSMQPSPQQTSVDSPLLSVWCSAATDHNKSQYIHHAISYLVHSCPGQETFLNFENVLHGPIFQGYLTTYAPAIIWLRKFVRSCHRLLQHMSMLTVHSYSIVGAQLLGDSCTSSPFADLDLLFKVTCVQKYLCSFVLAFMHSWHICVDWL